MTKKFLLGSCEVPGYGGAATVAYRMFQDLQTQGLDIAFVNLVYHDQAPLLRAYYGETVGNPRNLENVHTIVLERAPFYPSPAHTNLEALIRTLAPDVMIGMGFIATLLLKASAPDRRVLFITAGSDQAKQALQMRRAPDVTTLLTQIAKQDASGKYRVPPRPPGPREAEAVSAADLILTHAEMMQPLLKYYFPAHATKIFPETLWLAEWICDDALAYLPQRKPFAERTIDVLLVAYDWRRYEKNWELVRTLISKHPEWNIHVVGDTPIRPGNATYHGLIADRAAVFALMGDARVVVSTSRLDAAPGILWEAVTLGCNVVASKNCGNWELCHPSLLAQSLHVEEFAKRIRLALVREYQQNATKFLQPAARQLLKEILQVF